MANPNEKGVILSPRVEPSSLQQLELCVDRALVGWARLEMALTFLKPWPKRFLFLSSGVHDSSFQLSKRKGEETDKGVGRW